MDAEADLEVLEAGVLEDGKVRATTTGTPQGGVLSPLLANIYLNELDATWSKTCGQVGVLVRYADDLIAICHTQNHAKEALRRLILVMDRLGLALNPTKTRVVNLRDGQEGFDFLGFHHRKVKSWRNGWWYSLHQWPGRKAMKAAREKIRTFVGPPQRRPWKLKELIAELNPILRGWGNYFAMGNSAKKFIAIDEYVKERLYLFLSKKHGKSGRGWAQRWKRLNFYTEGLYRLNGTVRWHKQPCKLTDEKHRKAVYGKTIRTV